MNYPKLRNELESALAGEKDDCFSEIFKSLHCMSAPRVYAVINAIVSCMDAGEMYIEVGCYQGGSLIAALLDNQAQAIGVDNYSEFQTTSSFQRTLNNLNQFGVAPRVSLKNMSYKDFFADVLLDFQIAAYYYDGEHNYEGQLAGMEIAWSHLHSGSIVIVDDLFYPEVNRAVNQFIANHVSQVRVLCAIDSLNDCDSVWWNGVCVLRVL